MRQLVSTWVEAQTHDYRNTLGDAIKALSRECEIKLTYSRLAEWRRGKYTPSPEVLSRLLYDALPVALLRAGIKVTEEQQDALDRQIWNVSVVDGKQIIEPL